MVKILIKTLILFIFLTSGIAISQTKNSDSRILFIKHLDSLIVSNSNIFWNTTKTTFLTNNIIDTLFEKQNLLLNKK